MSQGRMIRMRTRWLIPVLLLLLIAQSGFALVSVSYMGYHPSSIKTATVYTGASSGTYQVVRSDGTVMKSGTLSRPTDFNGNPVNCQGNMSCLVADFTSVTAPGTYKIVTTYGNSSSFPISTTVYRDGEQVLAEYFDALRQQNSSYHADMNKAQDPPFPEMADGSYIMTAGFADIALIRMASAYRRNPAALGFDKRTFLKPGTPDVVEHMMTYARYLEGLQDAKIQARTDGVGVRLNPSVHIDRAFVPGPTSMTSIDIYDAGHSFVQTTPVVSLCGSLSGSAYTACINKAAAVYKCQADEPCLEQSYTEQTGTRLAGQTDGLGIDTGWMYEFACFYDVNLQSGNFNSQANPCMIYDQTETRENTIPALLAYTEAIPAINQYDPAFAQELLTRSVATRSYIKTTWGTNFALGDDMAGFYGAANFLLYDLTGNSTYLQDAYGVRNAVNQQFVADTTHGNDFYWEEYIRHKNAITNAGLAYTIGGNDPVEFFRGKMYGDYKDMGFRSIGQNGERVYQFDTNIQFQNSRFQLAEALLAAKTKDYSADTNPLIQTIADAQAAFLTGNNAVDFDQSYNTDLRSVSMIHGIGSFPQQYHSRLLMDSGYTAASGGTTVGMRGNDFTFKDPSSGSFITFDGKTTILGSELGSPGNGWRNETSATQLVPKTFTNGKTFIPGWISGVYDVGYDLDDIYDFRDDRGSYRFTESTDEIVASAMELFAYQDARYNNVAPLPMPLLGNPNGTVTPPPTNSTCYNSVQSIPANCTGGTISSDTWNGGRAITCGSTTITAWDKTGYFEMYKQSGGSAIKICIDGACISDNGYAKSTNFPICIGTTNSSNSTNSTCTPTNGGVEICDSKDNNCNGQVDENNVCAPPPNSTNSTCYNSVQSIPANCTGASITSDTWDGGRHITCGTTTVAAWDKTGFFEMYRQAGNGATKVCIGNTCIQNEGYAKSSNFPICIGNSTPPPTCTPTTEICDGKDNNCNGQIDENNVCAPGTSATVSIAQWYPKGRDYVFLCNANGFTPTSYDWKFGDGNAQYGRTTNDVYYRYTAAGNYNVACTAKNGATSASGALAITVA